MKIFWMNLSRTFHGIFWHAGLGWIGAKYISWQKKGTKLPTRFMEVNSQLKCEVNAYHPGLKNWGNPRFGVAKRIFSKKSTSHAMLPVSRKERLRQRLRARQEGKAGEPETKTWQFADPWNKTIRDMAWKVIYYKWRKIGCQNGEEVMF